MKDEALDLRIYLNIILKWWWIFLVAIAIGGVTGYLINRNPVPVYKASTKVLVEGRQTPGTPSASDIRSNAELAGYYSTLMNTRPVLEKVAENLPEGYTVGRLSGILEVKGKRHLH